MEGWDPDLQCTLLYSAQLEFTLIHSFAYSSPDTPPHGPLHHALDRPILQFVPLFTLNLLERSAFTSKAREEKTALMNGLASVLDRLSEGLRMRKILPGLLEEVGPSLVLNIGKVISCCR